MTVQIHIEDRIANALKAQADAAGLSLEEFVQRVLNNAAPTDSGAPHQDAGAFDRILDELFSASPVGVQSASTWSRSEIYTDHD
jgi:hypothetical protein